MIAMVKARPMIVLRSSLAVGAALYSFVRFGPITGTRVLAAAAFFVCLDVVRELHVTRRRFGRTIGIVAVALQSAILGILLIAPAPFGVASDVPSQVVFLQSPVLVLLLCFVASGVDARNPVLVWVAGVAVSALFLIDWQVVMANPLTLTLSAVRPERYRSAIALLRAINDPHYFNLSLMKGALFTTLLITPVLGFGLYRVRRLARITADRENLRRSLAAYFSPQVVETILASRNRELGPQLRDVAILDCDLVGFTTLAEQLSPEDVAVLLRSYRAAIERLVFRHDGAILSFTGDGIIAGFGLTGHEAAEHSLACARDILREWKGLAANGKSIPIAIGAEFGKVHMGLVGKARAMSLLVLGDAVEAAAALQWATREAGTSVLIGKGMRGKLNEDAAPIARELVPCPVAGAEAWRFNTP